MKSEILIKSGTGKIQFRTSCGTCSERNTGYLGEFRQTKAENEKELVVVQEELQQKKQIAGNTEVLLTADNLQQYVKKIEVDHKKNTYTEFAF